MKDNSNISPELFEAIERYINGTMEPDELKDFNDYLKIDSEFKTQVEDIKMILLGNKTQSLEPLNTFHEKKADTETLTFNPKKLRYLFFSKTAITTAIIIAISSIWFFSRSPNKKIYATYFKPFPALSMPIDSKNNYEFYDAMAHYKYENYDLAINKWEDLRNKKPNNDTLNYFLGVAYLANKNIDRAIPFLEKTIEIPNVNFSFLQNAYYYLGLAYIKNGNLNLAKKYLILSNTDASKEVMKKLD
ncbi:tetratricopeptide repeat protein [Mariniflexile litorale]|uniref:Tetratricopeptide repeat protein n=1 Tax=Mariniflexile litorale TaxID=3045158 RepID=A0AAU7EI56_9FLAO|nr:tetratricopeptide repeat protein [Mariniflexile sp. KMM 9835]MDQ8210150.1 tetratricopeptide repeat protein [Mariniflexile sp. KMM 9835]